jgi:hypothetical protein
LIIGQLGRSVGRNHVCLDPADSGVAGKGTKLTIFIVIDNGLGGT